MRADLHSHTHYSRDCGMSLDTIIRACQRQGVDCLAVTDHNAIAGALEMARIAPFKVIVGEEVKTSQGEIIGYFLKEEIPRGLSPTETVRRIKEQGGLAAIPHPFDRIRRSVLQREVLDEVVTQVDIIEGFNARTVLLSDSQRAEDLALQHRLPMSAGSDAHTPGELGKAGVEMDDFAGPQEFLEALRRGRLIKGRSSVWVHLASTVEKWKTKMRARGTT